MRLVSEEFLDQCWRDGSVKEHMAPRWGRTATSTIYKMIKEIKSGVYVKFVASPCLMLGLARLDDGNNCDDADISWRDRLVRRGWARPKSREQATLVIRDHDVVKAIRDASIAKNVDFSRHFAYVEDNMPLSQPPEKPPVFPGPVVRKANTEGIGHAAKRSRVSKHWKE